MVPDGLEGRIHFLTMQLVDRRSLDQGHSGGRPTTLTVKASLGLPFFLYMREARLIRSA